MLLNKDQLADFDSIKPHIKLRLCKTGFVNPEDCVVSDVPDMDGISYLPYIYMGVDDDGNHVTALVTRRLANHWCKDDDEIVEIARENTIAAHDFNAIKLAEMAAKTYQMSLDEFLEGFAEVVPDYDEKAYTSQHIVTTEGFRWGAINAILFPEEIQKLIGCDDYAIVPSSVHDTIVMPLEQGVTFDVGLITDVNNNDEYMTPSDVLSDKLYCYCDGKFGVLNRIYESE